VKILFVAEGVTLAQIVRLVTLARGLDPSRHELHFACASFDETVFADLPAQRHLIHSLSPAAVERAIAQGKPIYDYATLAAYLEEDRELLAKLRPDLVVSDLRWSMAVAAPLERVRHASLVNAYWSPHVARRDVPLPEHPTVERFGVEMASKFFPYAWPFVARAFAAPLNKLRRRHGLPALGSLRDVLTAGDEVLYADIPELVPTRELPSTHHFLGAVPWSPDVPLPAWWDELAAPIAYVTLGSSGRVDRLPQIVEGILAAGLTPVVATAGRCPVPEGAYGASFLPGDVACRRSALVVTNGGSSTGYQALAAGRPVLGVPFNLDQYFAMTAIAATGAGQLVRSGTLTAEAVTTAARALCTEPPRNAAARLADAFARYDAQARFREILGPAG
jgi:UDP:flavonoid glycosyltransferase YjiC (YdhE family)